MQGFDGVAREHHRDAFPVISAIHCGAHWRADEVDDGRVARGRSKSHGIGVVALFWHVLGWFWHDMYIIQRSSIIFGEFWTLSQEVDVLTYIKPECIHESWSMMINDWDCQICTKMRDQKLRNGRIQSTKNLLAEKYFWIWDKDWSLESLELTWTPWPHGWKMLETTWNNCICLCLTTFALLATCGASSQAILAFSYCPIEVCIRLDDSSRPDQKVVTGLQDWSD